MKKQITITVDKSDGSVLVDYTGFSAYEVLGLLRFAELHERRELLEFWRKDSVMPETVEIQKI